MHRETTSTTTEPRPDTDGSHEHSHSEDSLLELRKALESSHLDGIDVDANYPLRFPGWGKITVLVSLIAIAGLLAATFIFQFQKAQLGTVPGEVKRPVNWTEIGILSGIAVICLSVLWALVLRKPEGKGDR